MFFGGIGCLTYYAASYLHDMFMRMEFSKRRHRKQREQEKAKADFAMYLEKQPLVSSLSQNHLYDLA